MRFHVHETVPFKSKLMGSIAITVACRDSDVQNVRAMIVGPPETPYEFGFFEVRWIRDVTD